MNDRVELTDARALLNRRLCEGHMRAGVTIVDPAATYLEPDVALGADTVLDATVGLHATVGPFAHLRHQAVLGENVHVGNFVEIKKSTLGEGVKAGHLTYLGDATIGPRANIGAGTITCNYDGVRKNPTTIGAGAFIGSNSSLVAPIAIGDNAVTGAGTVAIHDVPADDTVVGNPARSIARKPAQT